MSRNFYLLGGSGLFLIAGLTLALTLTAPPLSVVSSPTPKKPIANLAENPDVPTVFDGPTQATGPFEIVTVATLKTKASLVVNQRQWRFDTNALGMFPRVTIPPKAVIPINLELKPHEMVVVQVLDGGKLGNDHQLQVLDSNSAGKLSFQFEATDRPGSSRVMVMRKGVRQVFDFWIGPDLAPRVAASN